MGAERDDLLSQKAPVSNLAVACIPLAELNEPAVCCLCADALSCWSSRRRAVAATPAAPPT